MSRRSVPVSTTPVPYDGPAVDIRGLTKRFGDNEVLKGIDFHVDRREVVVVIGPSGSGKSTLLRCINLLETPDSGQVLVDGVDICGPDTNVNDVRRRIGMVFQQFNLFPHLTALENVTIAQRKVLRLNASAAEIVARQNLERVGLAEKADHFPAQLSGGQQQRVAIARALAMDPEIMLFDEATSALDPELVGDVLNVMRGLAADGMTMMVVTHEIGFARNVADRVVFMADGVVVEEGPPSQLLDAPQHARTQQFLRQVHDR
jgi:polar amino acid transport system ATP-binding protein